MVNHVNNRTYPAFVYVVACLAGLGGFLFGYDTGVISGALLFLARDFDLSVFREEAVVSTLHLFAAIAALFSGFIADHMGRRWTILGAAVLFVIGGILMATAPSLALLLVGRAFVGLAIGTASLAVPLYVAELSPPAVRGFLVATYQLMVTIGIVVAYGIDLAFAPIEGWRWMLGLSIVPAAVLFLSMLFLPETPRWKLRRGKPDQARKILARMGHTPSEQERLIKAADKNLRAQKGGLPELFDRKLRPLLIIGMLLALFQQITGINTIIYYAPIIFEKIGLDSPHAALLATTSVGGVNVAFTIVAIWLVDRVGRRPLLIFGVGAMIVGLGALGGLWFLPDSEVKGILAVLCVMIYIAGFAVGLGPITWLFLSEVYPLRVRGVAMSCGVFINWIANFGVALTFLTLVDAIGAAITFWIYTALSMLCILFVIFFIPETNQKSLEEIEAAAIH